MTHIPIALQLYSVRHDCEKDLPGTLQAIAEMGYEGVDFAGYYGYDAATLRAMLDDLGLKVAGCHTGIQTLLGDEFAKTVEFNHVLGNKFLIVPWLPESYRNSHDAWHKTADLFNEIAAKLKPEGMYTGYHNHHIEFTLLEGELPWDIFFSNTVPEVVMQIDLGNAMHGGADPVAFLKRYPGRARTIHLKAYSATNDKALIGEDDVNWAEVFHICEADPVTEWYIVEQESYAYSPLECVDRCLQALRAMGK
ncbi:MAG TPA: sugar phosphate isomerase/epimerase [Anaerolineae bacterium]|nr:sugar phosphate isomerase/epimerase [Anaerolineae bacterium]HQK12672.1 sugar phosphate isomerase/epimerase [Anaerolineae bacterium]